MKAANLLSALGILAAALLLAASLPGLQVQAAPANISSATLDASNRDSTFTLSVSDDTPASDMDDDDDSDGSDLNAHPDYLPEGMDVQAPEEPPSMDCGVGVVAQAAVASSPHRGPVLRRRIFKKSW